MGKQRRPAILIFLSLVGMAAVSLAEPLAQFRQARWGMTEAQVRASEPKAPHEAAHNGSEAVLRYDSTPVGGLPAHAVYVFTAGKLARARYVFDQEHTELNDFIADYRAVEPVLRERHGKPVNERAIWTDDSTQLEPKSYLDQDRATPASILPSDPLVGLAVSLGHLRLFTEWANSSTRIVHVLTGENWRIVHQIEYRSAAAAGRSGVRSVR